MTLLTQTAQDEHATPYPSRGSARAASKKGKGGKARKSAPVKPIVSDYDSDDGRIISLKQQGHTDESVAKKLKQERRTVYTSKTVGNRWLRLKKMLERKDEERLDDELSDWHIGEVSHTSSCLSDRC